MNNLKTTNRLLLIIAFPIVFFILKTLSFIFIPLIAAMFIALLFLPLMRWFSKKGLPKPVGIVAVVLIIGIISKLIYEVIQLSTKEILSTKDAFLAKAETKIVGLVEMLEATFGLERVAGTPILQHYIPSGGMAETLSSTIGSVGGMVSTALMVLFFLVLLLSESINLEKIMRRVIFRNNRTSILWFVNIERDIVKFAWVKIIVSAFTGLGFTLACLYFDVSFPIFWGLFAFAINFVQMVGSVISVIVLTIFAFVELEMSGTLLMFIISITAVQALFGGVLEPIFMGKTFSINVITVLIMLMFWGFIWGIPGLIMSIPITVILKRILEEFPQTKGIADMMSGNEREVPKLVRRSS